MHWDMWASERGLLVTHNRWLGWYCSMTYAQIVEKYRDDPAGLEELFAACISKAGLLSSDGVLLAGNGSQGKFERHHLKRPQIFVGLAFLARRALEEGREKIDFSQLWANLRGNFRRRSDGGLIRRGTNDHKPFYTRLLLACISELRGRMVVGRMFTHGEYKPSPAMVNFTRWISRFSGVLIEKFSERNVDAEGDD